MSERKCEKSIWAWKLHHIILYTRRSELEGVWVFLFNFHYSTLFTQRDSLIYLVELSLNEVVNWLEREQFIYKWMNFIHFKAQVWSVLILTTFYKIFFIDFFSVFLPRDSKFRIIWKQFSPCRAFTSRTFWCLSCLLVGDLRLKNKSNESLWWIIFLR